MKPVLLVMTILLASFIATRAAARERLAVLVIADDMELGDNLNEVAIARLAELGESDLVGGRELRAALASSMKGETLAACLVRPACTAALSEAAHADRAVIAEVARSLIGFSLRLAVTSLKSASREIELERVGIADLDHLISALQTGLGQLSLSRPVAVSVAPPALAATAIEPSPVAQAPVANALRSPPEVLPDRRPPYFSYGSAALAILTLSAASVAGIEARATPDGRTRREAQGDLGRRNALATASNGLFIAGGALGVVAVASFVWKWP